MLQSSTIAFAQTFFNQKVDKFLPLSASGSNRKYYRLFLSDGQTYILTENDFVAENQTFFYLSQLFAGHSFAVPDILAVNDSQTAYIQQDLGDLSLLMILEQEGFTDRVLALYEQSLKQLAQLQIRLKKKIDFKKCYDFNQFDEKVVYNDLFYFKNFFLDRLDIPYQKGRLINDFERLAQQINDLKQDFFLFRDFQSRNIMVRQNDVFFIDYQGGMSGFVGYDLASLLFQAKAQLPQAWKAHLKTVYCQPFKDNDLLSEDTLNRGCQMGLILRVFQVFGAYGLRGLIEGKPHFLSSIRLNMNNIKYVLEQNYLQDFPYLNTIAQKLISENTQEKIKQILQV